MINVLSISKHIFDTLIYTGFRILVGNIKNVLYNYLKYIRLNFMQRGEL